MIEHKTAPLQDLRTLERADGNGDDGGEFEGLASVFFTVDESPLADIIAPGAFDRDLPFFLAEGFIGGPNHDWDCPIGRPVEARETPEGLYLRARLSNTARAGEVRTLLRDGVLRKLSIGFRALERRRLESAEDVAAWWAGVGYDPSAEEVRRARNGARLLTRVRLYEVSPVAVPANPRAVITAVKLHAEEEEARLRLARAIRRERERWAALGA